ncbi:MAG: replicative DNA helicase, partial [Anaerolineae bacterium]|nr:replicative DNA helicase [Anaerolineae bacterium]
MSSVLPPEIDSSPSPQTVPHSREAEEAVVGSILINPEAYFDVAQFLNAEDFYIHRNQWIWQAYARLLEARQPIDMLTVSESLEQAGQLAEVGGTAYLTALVNNTPTSLHAEAYGRIVEQTAMRRRLIQAANKIAKVAYQEDMHIETAIDEAEKAVFGASEHRLTSDLQSIQYVLSNY